MTGTKQGLPSIPAGDPDEGALGAVKDLYISPPAASEDEGKAHLEGLSAQERRAISDVVNSYDARTDVGASPEAQEAAPLKRSAQEIFGEIGAQILLLISQYGTLEKVLQYQPADKALKIIQDLINKKYVGCSQDKQKLWITENARRELSF